MLSNRAWLPGTLLVSSLWLTACQPALPPDQRPAVTLPPLPGDVAQGKSLYETECRKCHQTTPGQNHKGPQLDRIYGAPAALLKDYQSRYSAALKHSGWRWDAATLDRYLTNPEQALPHGKMLYDGLADAQQRRDIIIYLSTLRAPDIPRPAPQS